MLPKQPRKHPLEARTNSLSPLSSWRCRLARLGRAPKIALAVVPALLLIGCYSFRETERWDAGHPKETPTVATVDRLVRVNLGGRSTRPQAKLSVGSKFRVINTQSGDVVFQSHEAVRETTIKPAAGRGIDWGSEHFFGDDLLITPERDASIVVDGKTYRGELRVQRADNELRFVNHVDVEAYVRGVLRGELPRYFHEESFKAQAVAARTYVLYHTRRTPNDREWDVVDDEGSQMYVGVQGEDRVAVSAVRATTGEACVCDWGDHEDIFCTYYSSACGGLTQSVNNVKRNDPAVPPLQGNVICRDCYLADHYEWGPAKITKRELTDRIVKNYPQLKRLGLIKEIRPKSTTTDGRVIMMELIGDGEPGTLIGEDFRLCMGSRTLKSTRFDIETQPDCFIFKNGRGFGHGMGLCQWGMETKARRGWDYKRILAAYYPASTIKKLY